MFYANAGSLTNGAHLIHDSDHDCVHKHTENRAYFESSLFLRDVIDNALDILEDECRIDVGYHECAVRICMDCFFDAQRRVNGRRRRVVVRRSAI